MLQGKTIVLGISGGIASYKAATIRSKLVQKGATVKVIMTDSATQFITPLTLQALSKEQVYTDTFNERDPSVISHINVADSADLVVIAPATANIIGKLANGIADDMLSTTLLAVTAPIMIAPAMNVHMYEHPAVLHNIDILKSRGVQFIDPSEGQLACGYVGKGRLSEPEDIIAEVERFFEQSKLLEGKKVLVTAGGTIERIDPVRYITNDSSGKMGVAIAEEAKRLGADVTLVAANTTVRDFPTGVRVIKVGSAQQMFDVVMEKLPEMDVIVKAAAVADFRPKHIAPQKMKKGNEQTIMIELERTQDILQELGSRKTNQFIVGFAAETEHLEENAKSKLARKNSDFIVANDVSQEGAGFSSDHNEAIVFDHNGVVAKLAMMSKRDMATKLLELVASRLPKEGDRT